MLSFQTRLKRSIAKSLGVSPEAVNSEFIRKRRSELYRSADHRFVVMTKNGGHDSTGLQMLSFAEIAVTHAQGRAILDRFA